MDEIRDDVLALKASAKGARDAADWPEAVSDLLGALGLLQNRLSPSSYPTSIRLSAELADVCGLLGGCERRWGLSLSGEERLEHLTASVEWYDTGFEHERKLRPEDGNTYNRVNRLVCRVLVNPLVLTDEGTASPELSQNLGEAEELLSSEISGARQRDPWAYCDLGTVRLLQPKTDALVPFQELARLEPPTFVFESTLKTLQALSDAAADVRPQLHQAIAQLTRFARRKA